MYEKNYDPLFYDNICLLIISIQIALLIIKAILNGINIEHDREYSMVLPNNSNSGTSNKNTYKVKQAEKK
jgi:hypothetical protein